MACSRRELAQCLVQALKFVERIILTTGRSQLLGLDRANVRKPFVPNARLTSLMFNDFPREMRNTSLG